MEGQVTGKVLNKSTTAPVAMPCERVKMETPSGHDALLTDRCVHLPGRRRRMPFLVLPVRNRCESLFSRLVVKTVQFGQRFVEVRTISHRSNFSRFIERDPPILFVSKVLIFSHSIVKSFCASLSIWMQTSSFRSMLSRDSRKIGSFWKRS